MQQQVDSERLLIMHIGPAAGTPSAGDPASRIGTLLETLPADVHQCPDVYRGLARICSARSPSPSAVLVCADMLGAPELEFFSIVSRLPRAIPVYVYGHQRSQPRIARAIELGAVAEATESLLRALAASPPASPKPVVHNRINTDGELDSDVSAPSGRSAQRSVVTDTSAPPQDGPDIRGADQDLTPDESATPSVRVPWLRYADRPTRKAPSREGELVQRAQPDGPGAARASSHQPLLTEEELRALVGDDLAPLEDGRQPGEEKSL